MTLKSLFSVGNEEVNRDVNNKLLLAHHKHMKYVLFWAISFQTHFFIDQKYSRTRLCCVIRLLRMQPKARQMHSIH